MAKSNVRSSAYKAAGSWKGWGRIKTGDQSVRYDGPVPQYIEDQRNYNACRDDQNAVDKARIREQLAAGYDESLITVVPEGKSGKKRNKRK